jgi:signal transduction histidine kinase/CheY-like chemotaxis protein
VLGKSLNSTAVDALSELTFLNIGLHLLTFGRPNSELSLILSELYNSDRDFVVHVFDANRIGGYLLLRDIDDAPIAVVGVVEPRPIAAQGRVSIRYLLFGLLFLGSASGVIAALLLEWLVLRRVGLLSEQVTTIADSSDIERRVAVQGTDELARLGGDINHMLATLERVQVELRVAEEEAVEANTAKSRFLANMSHEIRTPLNAVMGMTNLLRESELSAEQRECVETIYQGSESLLTIISDILDLSKIESGKLELEAEPLNLRMCVELALDIMAVRAGEKHLELLYRMNPDVPEAICGDITRLRQILLNLLSNAIKFTDHGEVIVTVHTGGPASAAKDGRLFLHFAVTDTGIGIPPERIDRLFRPFSQIDASTTRKYGGTGLGLAISRRLVELMGGEMWVESSGVPGDGSAFHFTICTEAAESLRPNYLAGQQPHLLGKRVLIVDDNTNNRRMLLRQIQQWGMTGLTTGSPLEALDWLRQQEHFDVALLDMHMDELDGKALAQAIRRIEAEHESDRMPLLILSSSASRESDAQALAIFATLSKPLKLGTLYDALRRLFGSTDAPEAPAHGAPLRKRTLAEHYPLRVLLTEDNLVNQKLAQRLLKRLGYETDVAEDGQQALDMVSDIAYDVVLMDVQMPVLDGLDATRRIRTKLPPDDQPYIIAMTANAMIGDREACLAAGMNAYIAKPIQFAELDEAIEAAAVARQHA